MNKLSWFLYSVDLLYSIGQVCVVMFSLSMLFLFFSLFSELFLTLFGDEEEKVAIVFIKRVRKILLISCFVCFLPALLIPDKKTMYLILASEVGQKAYESPENKELLDNMRSVITRELKKLGE